MGAAAAKMLPAAKMLQAAAGPLDDDNLLSEILLRLPPQPSSLPRASAVCKRWRSLVTDRGFMRRFRLRRRRNPPLLGYFYQDAGSFCQKEGSFLFEPTMEPPNRVPPGRFSCPIDDGDSFMLLGSRHGLVLFLLMSRDQLLVWDPVTGDQHSVVTPPGFDICKTQINGTVLRSAGDDHHFQVVMLGYDYKQEQDARAVIFIYSSVTHLWSPPISAPLPDLGHDGLSAVLVGNSLYWLISSVILKVDLCRQNITVKPLPVDTYAIVMRAEGGGVCLLSLSDYTVQLWEMNTDCDGAASWVVGRSFELDKLLQLNSKKSIWLMAYAEENNVLLLRTFPGVYIVQLESLQFSKLVEDDIFFCCPFESVYAAGIGGGNHGADQDMLV